MKNRVIYTLLGLALVIGAFCVVRSIRDSHYPIPTDPSAEWEPYVSSLDAQREAFFVVSGGLKLEADLFIPNGGADQKPAVVFSPGSGDALYQNYSKGFIETFILDQFLQNDFAVLLINKRGMGQSEGNYVKNSVNGRADDLFAAVQSIQSHPKIDAENIGLVGHSQGGWVVTQAAADHPDIAFFISLAGPTTTMRENAADNAYHAGVCQGMEGEELDAWLQERSEDIDLSIKIGDLTNFGMFGFDARNMGYDPQLALQTIQVPGLLVYAENDSLVTPSLNIEQLDEIFSGEVPDHLSTVVIEDATHSFTLSDTVCVSYEERTQLPQSEEVVSVLNNWLKSIGY